MEELDKPKRNKPCENCRKHRRKCNSDDTNSKCERCQRINAECVFKFTEKPPKLKQIVSTARQNELLNVIGALEQQTEELRLQLLQLKKEFHCSVCEGPDCKHKPWRLTISRGQKGIQVETTVKSLSDLETFVNEGLSFFRAAGTPIPTISDRGGRRMMDVTYPLMNIERVFKTLFLSMSRERAGSPLIPTNHFYQQFHYFKLKMIQNYFSCFGYLLPILPIPIYLPKLCGELDSLLANAVAFMAAYSPCNHADLSGFSYTRAQLADACRIAARKKLQDDLFEDEEPTPERCCALHLISLGNLFAFKGKEARTSSSLCWQMINQVKPIIPKCHEDEVQEQIRTRVFYIARYTEFMFLKNQDTPTGYAHTIAHVFLFPQPLPCELADQNIRESISCFLFLIRIMSISRYGADDESVLLGFFGGMLDNISSASIQKLEEVLLQFWEMLPSGLRIGKGPFEYMDPKVIRQCTLRPFALRANLVYYVYWLNLQSKVMQSPQKVRLSAYIYRMDGERALMITSICADAATKIYALLEDVAPCMFDMQWLSTTLDVLHLLSQSSDNLIRETARANTIVLSKIIQNQLQFGIYHKNSSMLIKTHTSSSDQYGSNLRCCSTSSCSNYSVGSSNSSINSHVTDSSCESTFTEDTNYNINIHSNSAYTAPYYTHLKDLLETYLIDNKIIKKL
ncbi:hypothetical protein G6F37_007941 [Rhizopus arrhizus]|nr:hypothetical protein G6F38_010565 [Rhizopus arrhizus]KAG1156075.1 hypothetical protein G6F37_007941 [Rhizopus arrhizus]